MAYPLLYHFVAFNADPGDPAAVPVWTGLGNRVRRIDGLGRGRQYELGTTRIEASQVTFRDVDEYLNTLNTASPYYPYVQPYRQIRHLAVWRTGLGAFGNVTTGNLLNLGNWRTPVDPSFESYALATAPSWITVQNVGAVVSTTDPQAGTQCLLGAVASSTTRQGIQWYVPCVPGVEYTSSVYVRQAGASTQEIRVTDQTLVADNFNRTTASGWGTPTAGTPAIGSTWTLTGGSNSERATVAASPDIDAYASVTPTTTATVRYQTQGTMRDGRQRVRVRVPEVATGSFMSAGVVARYADASNHYYCELRFGTDRTVTLRVVSRVAGVDTLVGSAYTLPGVYYLAGDEFYLDFYLTGSTLAAAAWRTTDNIPETYGLSGEWQVNTTSTSITAAGAVGCRAVLDTGNTNTTPELRFYGYNTVGSILGSTTATTGAYARISVTWTATQPLHYMALSTTGTAVAGAVNYDSFQHEAAATASAFGTDGAVIYPVDASLVERWPSRWESSGFEGYADAGCTSALATVSAVDLPSEYDWQIRKLSPDFYWTLSGGSGTTIFGDSTGNGNAPLEWNISKYGVGTVPEGGGSLGAPGGVAGQTGVTFTPPSSSPGGSQLAATTLGAGPTVGTGRAPVRMPASIAGTSGIWRMTVALLVNGLESNAAQQNGFSAIKSVSSSSSANYIPINVNLIGDVSLTNYVPSSGSALSIASGSGLSGITVTDGLPHLVIGIIVQDAAGDTSAYKYIDGVLDGANTVTTASLGGVLGAQSDSVVVGGFENGYAYTAIANGVIGKVAVWNRELNAGEVENLTLAWRGWTGETSAYRIDRHLTQAQWTGARRVSGADDVPPSTGDPITTMQAPSWTGRMSGLQDIANTQQAEQGTFVVDADGAFDSELRQDRFLRITPQWVIGEDSAGGEYPYLEGIRFDHDPTYVFADVSVARPGGGQFLGGTGAARAASVRRYFPRSFPLDVDVETDQQAQDEADWVFYSHRAPLPRVEVVRFNPAANPALWPFVLGVRIGDRVTVKRRAKAANSGAGLTISVDMFVENIGHDEIDFDRGTWITSLWLSPIGAPPGPTLQPWILENSTYGVLDSTTVLGW